MQVKTILNINYNIKLNILLPDRMRICHWMHLLSTATGHISQGTKETGTTTRACHWKMRDDRKIYCATYGRRSIMIQL